MLRRALPIVYRLALLAVVVAASVHALSAVWHFTIDDAGISYAYAKHLADGHGPVAAIGGPWIEGYSNPLWVFLLLPTHWLGLEMGGAAKALGALLFAVGLGAGMAWLARAGSPAATPAGRAHVRSWRSFGAPGAGFALGAALCAELMVWVPAGLENALFSALLLGLCALDAREAENPEAFGASGLCAFALSITRPEAVMYAAPLVAIKLVQALRGREPMRRARTAVLLFVVPLALYHVGHYLVFHELVPNTYYAKPSWRGGPEYLKTTALASGLAYALPLAVVGLVGRWRLVLLPAWACVAGSAFVLYSGGDWMPHGRFLSLFGACVLLLAARGASQLGRLGERAVRGLLPQEVIGFALAAAALVAWARYQLPRLADIQRTKWCHFCERIADTRRIEKLASRAGFTSQSLVTQDFGGPAWLSTESFYPIDFLGLCDRSIVLIRGKRARGGVRNDFRFFQYLIHEQPTAPTWVFVPPNFWPGFDRSLESRDYYGLSPRLLPRARRDSFFTLHRGELVDYFPPIPSGGFRDIGGSLALVGSGLFADPGAAGEGAAGEGVTLAPGARVLALVSLAPLGKLSGSEQVTLEISAGAATASSPAVPLDRGIQGVAGQLAVGEPLGFELPLVLPDAPASTYRLALRVAGGRGAPLVVPLGELAAGSALPRYERALPRYPAALPPPTGPELRALRPAVTMVVEQARRAGQAAPADEALSRRLASTARELEARGQTEQAYLASVWATHVDRSAWEELAEDVHRLRSVAMDDDHATELALLRRYYASGTVSELARLVAFYLAGRRALEADYFFQRWAGASLPEQVAPSARDALGAELRAQLAGDVRGAASILAQLAVDPLGGGDFEVQALDGWQGHLEAFHAGPEQRAKGSLRGHHGRGILSSGNEGEAARGELTSREFRIEGRLLTALVGGGTLSQKVGVELQIDGEKPMPVAGNDSENLWPAVWDVERFQGKLARFRVFDQSKRRHVTFDRVLSWR